MVESQPFVFLSYSRNDGEFVARLRTDLQARGIRTWLDSEGLQSGTPDWEEALRHAIRSAYAILLIASPAARSSPYVKDELRIAKMYQRPVYPIWIAGTQWIEAVPLGWGGIQYIDAREAHYQKALDEIVMALRRPAGELLSTDLEAPDVHFEPRNPYKGLHAFTSKDAIDFFGRDALVAELTAALQELLVVEKKTNQSARLLTVIGPSGSGKSSVVLAGLIPRLQASSLPGSHEWVYLDPIVPGQHPIEALSLTLSSHFPSHSLKTIREDLQDGSTRGLHLLAASLTQKPNTKVVLFVDQFEELFTQTADEKEREHFVNLLVTALTEPRGPVIVVLTLRADFSDRTLQYPELGKLIEAHHNTVFPMKMEELQSAIVNPARLPDVQLTFEDHLVDELLFEVQNQTGSLPLLQFTLDELFRRRSGHFMTLHAYREIGGIKGALTMQAEATYMSLPSEEHRRLARTLFLRLIDPGQTERDITRQRIAFSELSLPDPTQAKILQETVNTFIAARLLTADVFAGVPVLEISHESLIREWALLRYWIQAGHNDLRLEKMISGDAAEWISHGKSSDWVYRGVRLSEAKRWAERNMPSIDMVEFIQAGDAENRQPATTSLPAFRVFVSHSSKDDDFGRKLVKDLRRALGSDEAVWYDASGGLHGGDAWWDTIVDELTKRNVFILILSPDAVGSKWVRDELRIAWRLKNAANMRIVPVLYRHSPIRADLETLQIVSFLRPKSYEDAFDELLQAIRDEQSGFM